MVRLVTVVPSSCRREIPILKIVVRSAPFRVSNVTASNNVHVKAPVIRSSYMFIWYCYDNGNKLATLDSLPS